MLTNRVICWILPVLFSPEVFTVIRFYEGCNFDRYMGEFVAEDDCKAMGWAARKASSLKTDECIMVYKNASCTGESYLILPGEYPSLYDLAHETSSGTTAESFDKAIAGYQKCTSDIGGPRTHVTFYDFFGVAMLEYSNLCERVQISSYGRLPFSFTNNGNCIILEVHHTLSGTTNNVTVHGGRSQFSIESNVLLDPYCIIIGAQCDIEFLSVRPCKVKDSCTILNSTVTSFKIIDPGMGIIAKKCDLSMSATTTFINDGWATVSQEYTATKTITEATEMSLVRSTSAINNWNVQAGVETEFSGGIPLIAENKVKISLSTSYTREESQSTETGKTERHEVSTQFSVNQRIEIEPCTKYSVDSYVKMTEGYPMLYNVTFEVSGMNGDRRMNAEEVKEKLVGLGFVRYKDNETVIAMEQAAMYVDFGVIESVIDGEGEVIQECLKDFKKVGQRANLTNLGA